jgi:hypothetical protein
MNLTIPEFTVAGISHGNYFAHQWYVASDDHVDPEILRVSIDEKLKILNDDYAVERKSALKEIKLEVLPEKTFLEFMQHKGKVGGQHKFPRVLKGKILEDWKQFIGNG